MTFICTNDPTPIYRQASTLNRDPLRYPIFHSPYRHLPGHPKDYYYIQVLCILFNQAPPKPIAQSASSMSQSLR